MKAPTRLERAGIEAVARHFAATCESGKEDSRGASLTVGGRRIALTLVAVTRRRGAPGGIPRLRFDRVATELAGRLQSALQELVPSDQTVMVTITAPILQAGRTAAAIVESIRDRLERRSARMEIDRTMHGNAIRASLVTGVPERMPRTVVFVHNPDPRADGPGVLFRLTRSLLDAGAARDRRKCAGSARGRWLVLVPEAGLPHAARLRHVLAPSGVSGEFERILLVRAGGRVEILAG